MPKIDIAKLPVDTVNMYPDPFWKPIVGRERKRLGNAVGLSQFGVNLTTLKPGAWSSQRHWHATRTSSSTCSKARSCCARTTARRCSSPATPRAGRPMPATAIA